MHSFSRQIILLVAACIAFLPGDTRADTPQKLLDYKELPTVPSQAGVSGAFVGTSGGALLIAGGKRSDGSISDAIFILGDTEANWELASEKLSAPLVDGVSITQGGGLICIGGSDGDRARNDVFKLELIDGKIVVTNLPALPAASVQGAGALLGNTLYVISGKSDLAGDIRANVVWKLDLAATDADPEWQEIESWPGSPRYGAIAAGQDGSFIVLGGIGPGARALTDGYLYKPSNIYSRTNVWRQIADAPVGSLLGPRPALPLGQTHIAVSGSPAGADGRTLYTYHTITDMWSERISDSVPQSNDASVAWKGEWAIKRQSFALIGPGGSRVATLITPKGSFRPLDWLALLAYLVGIMAMGFYFSKREHSTEDYFLGGHRVPWWAAGLSIFGTQLSAMTFMATPAVTFSQDWVRMIAVWMYLPVAYFAIIWFLPFYRKLNITTVYEYLEARFNVAVRLLASAVFIASALIRVAVVVYLPALALEAVTGVDVSLCIFIMGALCIAYTVLGGMEAVIWTDVVQVVVLMVGAVMCLGVCLIDAGGFANTISIGAAAGKFHTFNWGWHLTEMTVFVMVFGNFIGILEGFASGQPTVQRYMTTPTERDAAKGIWMTCILSVVTAPVFYFLGTSLFVFYTNNPAELVPGRTDAIVPWFIAQQLPAGIAGIVIGGIFAASMSSLDSAMHSAATAYVTDFHQRFKKGMSQRSGLILARWVTVITGVLGTSLALVLAGVESLPIFDLMAYWTGRLIGGIGGLFFLAVFTTRTTSFGALVGVIVGTVVPYWVSESTSINFTLFIAVGAITCALTGYLASFIPVGKKKDITGLTLYTLHEEIPGR